jgi:nucleotide-binding universal stress UspA family protein
MKEGQVPGSIICGLDDSESAKGAARVARELSAHLGMRLVFVHVVDAESPDETTTALVQRLHQLTERAMELECGAEWLVDAGHPSDRLLAQAAAEKASLIVVGSHDSRSPLLRSVSAEVSRRASCPVVVVPLGAGVKATNEPRHIHKDSDVSGGIARLGLGSSEGAGDFDVAGGVVRFNLGVGWRDKVAQ